MWTSSYLSLLALFPFRLCLPLFQLPPSPMFLHCLSLRRRRCYLPFLSRPPRPTLHVFLSSLPCVSSFNVSAHLLRPLLDLLPPLALPH